MTLATNAVDWAHHVLQPAIYLTKFPCGCICHYMNDCLLFHSFKQLVIQFHRSVRISQSFVTPVSLFCLCNCSLICFRADSLSSLYLKCTSFGDRLKIFMMISGVCVRVWCSGEITFPQWHVLHINRSCSQCLPVGGSIPPAPSKSIYH